MKLKTKKMRLKSSFLVFLVSLIVFNFFLSCRVSDIYNDEDNKTTSDLKKIEAKELIRKVHENNVVDNLIMLNTKVLINNNGREFNFNANIHIKKDSIIWASIKTTFGVEILRSIITRDSIFILDRINKSYYCNSSSYLASLINFELNYDIIEQILAVSQKIELTTDFETEQYFMSDLALWINDRKEKYTIDISNFKVKEYIKTNNLLGAYLRVSYNDFNMVSSVLFPHKIVLEAKGVKQDIYWAQFIFKKVRFNKKFSLSFNIPKSYTKID